MNAKLKTFLMALVLVPCAFIFAACGGDQLSQAVSVDTSGNYQTATATEAQTAATADTNLEGIDKGHRFQIEMNTKVGNETMRLKASLIYKETTTATETKSIMAIRAEATNFSMAQMGDLEVNGKATLYYIDTNYVDAATEDTEEAYMDANMTMSMGTSEMTVNGKYAIDLGDETNADLQSIVAMMASLREMMAMFTPDNEAIVSWTDSNTYKIATEGTTTKIEVTIPEYKEGNDVLSPEYKVYFVMEDGKFVGMSTQMILGSNSQKVAISAFDGEVELPDFEGYTDTYTTPAATPAA